MPKLYDWYKLPDAEGEKALLYFKEMLNEKKLLDPDAIFSLYYKFYWYAEKGALGETPDEFNKKMNEYLDSIKDDIHYQDSSSFGGMDSYEFMTEAFEKNVSEFRDKLKKIVLARKEFINVDETTYFNAQMKSENDFTFNLFCKKIEKTNSYNLEKIKEKDFVESFVSLKNIERKNRFRETLETRYAGGYLSESQKNFLMGIFDCANDLWNDYKAQKTLTPSQFSLYYLKKTIIKILAKQDSYNRNTGNQVSFTEQCSKCGSLYSVVAPYEPGHNESEGYNCPVCNTERHVRASLPPSVNLIAKL